jgi:hypothetical protein
MVYSYTPGDGAPTLTPEQLAILKEAAIRGPFVENLGNSLGPYIMG